MTGVITSLPPLVEQPPGQSSSNPAGLPGVTYTAAIPTLAQTWTGLQTFNPGTVRFAGVTSGYTYLEATAIASGTVQLPAIAGTDTLLTNNNIATVTNKSIDGLLNTITNVPTGALDPDLQAIAALTGTGFSARTAADTWALRTVTGPAAGITVTNGSGVAGNPTLALANDLAALEALASTGIARRTGTDAWSVGTAVNLASEVAGNLPVGNLNSGTGASATTFWRGDGTWVTPAGAGTVTNVATGQGLTGGPITATGTVSIDGAFGFRNRIINGRFRVDQRNLGAAVNVADNAYWGDRWRQLTESTSHLCTAADTTMGGGRKNGKMSMQGGTDKGGYWQVIEGINCKDLRGKTVTLSAAIQVSNARLGNIKMGIVEFTGTEDAVSGDPISAWGADGVTPTLAASYTFINTPANLSVTTSDVTYSATVTLGSTFNNLAIFIWNDDKAYTTNDSLYVSDVQLEQASAKTNYAEVSISAEYDLCTYYYRRRVAASANEAFGVLQAYSTTAAWGTLENWRSPMRIAPAATASALGDFRVWSSDAVTFASPNSVTFVTNKLGASINALTVASALFGFSGQATQFSGTVSGTAAISYNSEL